MNNIGQKYISNMKNIKFLMISYTVIVMSLAACVSKKNEDCYVTKVNVDISRSENLMDEVASMQVILISDESQNSPVSYSKVQWEGDSLYILDSFKSKGLFLFDKDGTMINSYNKRGHGPDEFLSLSDFILTEDGIILLDTYANANCIYLDRNFEFLKKTEAEEKAAHFVKDSNGGFWFDRGNIAYGDNKDKLVYISSGKRVPILEVPKNIENITFSNSNSFISLGGDVFAYLPVLEPCVYRCEKGKAEKILEFDFGEKWPEFDIRDTATHPLTLMKQIVEEGKIYGLNVECDGEYMVFSFNCADKFYVLFLNHEEPESYKLFHLDNTCIEEFGPLLTANNGSLTFGEDGKIIVMDLKFS